jgi:hypothetical protein
MSADPDVQELLVRLREAAEVQVGHVHICCFSSLDDVPRKLKGEAFVDAVLDTLRRVGRFSCFEASHDARIGSTIASLIRSGQIKTTDIGYPWTAVTVVEP